MSKFNNKNQKGNNNQEIQTTGDFTIGEMLNINYENEDENQILGGNTMSELNNKNNGNGRGQSPIQGVNENSYMHKCYFGSLAKITGYDVLDFLQGYIKNLKGEVGVIYSQNPETGEVEGMLAIPYRANSQAQQGINTNGMIPIPGINSTRGGRINEQVLKSIDRIKLQGFQPTVLNKEDAILFRIDFAAVAAEMMNPAKGYGVSIDEIKLQGQNDIVAIVSVYKSKNQANTNRMTRLLQNQRFSRQQHNNQQPQRYNGGRR